MNTVQLRKVGRLVGLWRYPVKSMGPENLQQADASWFGLSGDRRWAFVRDEAVSSDFPWLTLRERANMNHYRPFFVDAENPDKSATRVQTPQGHELDVTDPNLAAELYPRGARVIRQNRGCFDCFPLSLITSQTLRQLSLETGLELDVQRFRPNFLVDAQTDQPFVENAWLGKILRIGSMRFRIDKRDGRCVVITIDPITNQKEPNILRQVAQKHEGCLGVYGSVVEPGKLEIQDPVYLEID
ncbi:MAG: MOSC domain-containing protein [Acidobacteria bacterium]|nr:MOSC domain-containing protein [Acidobacteriota bacterium]MCB9396316.1 MOSC domain-containing protein [Acidobacteriota bacterium]